AFCWRGVSKKFVSRVGGVGHNLPCTPQGPGCIQVLERWQIASNHPLSRTNDTLQSDFVLGSGSVPDGDGGGEDGLNDGGVKVHHHCLWQVELLQLPQEVYPLMCFFGEGDDVQLPLEVLGSGWTQGDGGGWGWVLSKIYKHLH